MKKVTSNYALVIFDLDGTLVDTAADVHFSMNLLRAENGLPPISFEEAKKAIGPGPDLFVKYLTPTPGQIDIKEIVRRFREIYWQHLLEQTCLFPGMESTLNLLAELRIKLAVATNKPGAFSRRILEGLGVAHHFLAILGPDDVEKQKPAPDVIYKAMAQADTTSAETLMVGDSEFDIRAARAAGVDICAVSYGYSPAELFTQLPPTFLVTRPEEIVSLCNHGAIEVR